MSEKTYLFAPQTLNGERKHVINGSQADIFIVFAQTDALVRGDIKQPKLSAFVVERDFGGITTTPHQTSEKNLQVSDVLFENTQIPAGIILIII